MRTERNASYTKNDETKRGRCVEEQEEGKRERERETKKRGGLEVGMGMQGGG